MLGVAGRHSLAAAAEEFRAVSHRQWQSQHDELSPARKNCQPVALTSSSIRQLEWRGREHQLLRQYDQAASYFKQALIAARVVDNAPAERTATASLCKLRRVLVRSAAMAQTPEQAVEYCVLALDAARLVDDQVGEKAALSTLGELCGRLGQFELAIGYTKQALAIAEMVDDIVENGRPKVAFGAELSAASTRANALRRNTKAAGAPQLERALNSLYVGATRAQEERLAERKYQALFPATREAIATEPEPEPEPEPELERQAENAPHPPTFTSSTAAVVASPRSPDTWEALVSPGRDRRADALISGRRAWLTKPGLSSPRSVKQSADSCNSSDSSASIATSFPVSQVESPNGHISPRNLSDRSQSCTGEAPTLTHQGIQPQTPRAPKLRAPPRQSRERSRAVSGRTLQGIGSKSDEIHGQSLESLMEERRAVAGRWHPPMVLPSFYWSIHYYYSLSITSTTNNKANNEATSNSSRRTTLGKSAKYTEYKQVLADEAVALRKQLELSVAKHAAVATGSQGLSVEALARRATRDGIDANRIDAVLSQLQGQAGSGEWSSASARASESLINLLVAHHGSQADRLMAKYFKVPEPPDQDATQPRRGSL